MVILQQRLLTHGTVESTPIFSHQDLTRYFKIKIRVIVSF